MESKVSSKNLINKLNECVSICRSSFHEDYKYISIEAIEEAQEILISSFNIEIILVHRIKAKVIKSGKSVVLAKHLLSVLQYIGDYSDEIILLNKTKLNIITKNKSVYSIAIVDNSIVDIVIDFKKDYLKILSNELIYALSKGYILSKKNSPKPYELGVFIEPSKSGSVFVSLNNASIAIAKLTTFIWPIEEGSFISQYVVDCILDLLPNKNEYININISEKNIEINYDDSYLILNTMYVKFPNYKSVIPKTGARTLIINREELIRNLDIALVYGEDIIAKLVLINSEMSLEFNSINDGQSISYLKINENSTVEKFEAKFSCSILKSLLSTQTSDNITFEIRSDKDPFIIRGDKNYLQLMMLRR